MQDVHIADVLITLLILNRNVNADYAVVFGICLGIVKKWHGLHAETESLENPLVDFASHLLFQKSSKNIDRKLTALINALLILYLDHGLTSAAYSARLCKSEGGSVYSCLVAALATHKSSLPTFSIEHYESFIAESGDALKEYYSKETRLPPLYDDFCTHTQDPRVLIFVDFVHANFEPDIFTPLTNLESHMAGKRFIAVDD
ncbi:bifunctional Citrate synthase/Citrate synthase superfamily/Citrate synthase-like [Babesia duncani]|uniref:Bifunctional Citrate synthase/Citrate synthase superfamily/Citrate synthase-like n=1 Tax=Babesia duncani TaxID=323732 RepID=A0AAD9PND2_9APIC|nr:bifunctional Citrate synthase/Citrate synthase superfamily/Citrate synthase-like [Babesia duncani]